MDADAETLNRAPAPELTDEWELLTHASGRPKHVRWTSPCARVRCDVWFNPAGPDWRWVVDLLGIPGATVGNEEKYEAGARSAGLTAARERLAELDGATCAVKPDPINHPTHYTASPYEAITVIESVGSGYCRGNALKYLCRAPHKGQLAADLRKAAWYVRRLVTSREDFSVMGRTEAKAVATSWAGDSGVRHDAIRCLLTGKNYLGAGADDFSADALATALEAEAERVGK